MEVINNFTATVYYRGNIDEETGEFDHSSSILGKKDGGKIPEDTG